MFIHPHPQHPQLQWSVKSDVCGLIQSTLWHQIVTNQNMFPYWGSAGQSINQVFRNSAKKKKCLLVCVSVHIFFIWIWGMVISSRRQIFFQSGAMYHGRRRGPARDGGFWYVSVSPFNMALQTAHLVLFFVWYYGHIVCFSAGKWKVEEQQYLNHTVS